MKWDWGRNIGRSQRADRRLTHGEMRLVVLHLLARGPMTGQEIAWDMQRRLASTGLESAAIDAVVAMLDQLDYVRMQTHAGTYAITEDGAALLERNRRLLDMVLGLLGGPVGTVLPLDAPILQSIEDLRGAVGRRLVRGCLTQAQSQAVTRTLQALTIRLEHA